MFELLPGYNEAPMTELAMQLPMLNYGTPMAPDWNGDGVLDLWHHNHYVFTGAPSRWSDPSIEIKGPDREVGGCMVDWDAVLQDGRDGSYYAANGGDGFIEWSDANTNRCFDVHSSAFIDLDGDGLKDLFLVTGGGRGVGNSHEYDNALFWGQEDDSELGYRLVGGRDTALAAGLHGRNQRGNERGRHQYWLDVDGDGRLDVILLSHERNDGKVIPGKLYRNIDGRTFEQIDSQVMDFAEFASMAVLTDVNGDGYARELVVPSDCEIHNAFSGPDKQNYICKRYPRGGLNVYSFDSQQMLMRVSTAPPFEDEDRVRSIATGDYDLDGLADVAVLWRKKVAFYLSSAREERCFNRGRSCRMQLGEPDSYIRLSNPGAIGMRFADFNLDGHLDMLVINRDPGQHTIYELLRDGTWQEMQGPDGSVVDFGALNSPTLMMGGDTFCGGVLRAPDAGDKGCEDFFGEEDCNEVQYKQQFIICNMRFDRPDKPGVQALGATVADLDNDGYPDIIMSYRFGSTVIMRNTLGDASPDHRFFAVRLDKAAGPAESIGAIVKLTTTHMGPFQNETYTQTRVLSSLSHQTDDNGSVDDRIVFGLGGRGRIKWLTVHWPHCCQTTEISGFEAKLWERWNDMDEPYEIGAPTNCDDSCRTDESSVAT